MPIKYPPKPEPLRIEFEVTNYCNASCEFCPRFNITKQGNTDFKKFQNFIGKFAKIKQNLWLTKHFPKLNLPIVVFGGYGEPLINPQIFKFIEYAKKAGFQTELITNGLLLDQRNTKKIAKSGLDKLSISLHTLKPELNKQITKLPNVIPNIKKALTFFDNYPINIEIWRVAKLDGSNYDKVETKDSYQRFLSDFQKQIKVLGPTPAWNRGGQFKSNFYHKERDSHKIACQTSYFTISVSYNGDIIICCCDFSTKNVILSKNWNFNLNQIQKKIIYTNEHPPKMCTECRKPKNNFYESDIYPYYNEAI